MTASSAPLRFGPRFCGPPGTANGGFACGSIAQLLGGAAEVTLRRPIPLDRPLTVHHHDGGTLTVSDGDALLAEARPPVAGTEPAPPTVPRGVARAVAGTAGYFTDPAFPGCFVCGPDRGAGDGLRIFPGRVGGRPVWAAPWTPDASVAAADGTVAPEVVWAALDCPSGIAAAEAAGLPRDTAALLGRMTVDLVTRPRAGQPCDVVAWAIDRDGRRLTAASALLDAGGAVLATARTVWLTLPRPALRQAAGATA